MLIYPRTFASNERMISFAQNGEDILIDRVFRKKTGFYIDAGAFHPVLDSVTKHFSILGWRGINIEPDSTMFAEFQRDRPGDINLSCAVGRTRGEVTFHQLANKEMSTILPAQLDSLGSADRATMRSIKVEMRTLADICAEFVTDEIDFLKIDVEGAEGDVIEGADWNRFRPRLLVIEATKPMTSEPNCETWEPRLLSHGYVLQCFDGINRYYLRREDEALAPQLSVPVNILDLCVPFRETELQHKLAAQREELEELQHKLAAQREELDRLRTAEAERANRSWLWRWFRNAGDRR